MTAAVEHSAVYLPKRVAGIGHCLPCLPHTCRATGRHSQPSSEGVFGGIACHCLPLPAMPAALIGQAGLAGIADEFESNRATRVIGQKGTRDQ